MKGTGTGTPGRAQQSAREWSAGEEQELSAEEEEHRLKRPHPCQRKSVSLEDTR